MGAPEFLEEVAAALAAEDWQRRREAVGRAGDLLRTALDAAATERLADAFRALVDDPKWEVRNALANATQHLRHPAFDAILARLLDDPNGYVRRTAERSLERRRRLGQLARRRDQEVEWVANRVGRLSGRDPEAAAEVRALARTYFSAVAAVLAHDVRGVLTSLRHTHKTLERELSRREVPEGAWRETLARAAQRVKLIDAIVSDAKQFASSERPRLQKVRLEEVVREAAGIVNDRLRERPDAPEVALTLEVPRHLVVDAPRTRLVQALTNLLQNAFEAIERKGSVRVSATAQEGARVELRVADDGVGIREDDLSEVFLPGRSTKKGDAARRDNTGWGLAITRKIVEEDCGGRIELESEEGRGTTVILGLPAGGV